MSFKKKNERDESATNKVKKLSREKDDDRNPYKTEKDVKDHALARLEDMKKEQFGVEKELKSLIKQSSDERNVLEENMRRLAEELKNLITQSSCEKSALEEKMKRLEEMNQDKCTVEEELKSLIKQSSDEKCDLEEKMKSLQQEKDITTHENDNNRRQYEAELKLKENVVERLQQEMYIMADLRDSDRCQFHEEINAKENTIERLSQEIDNISQERDDERNRYMNEKAEKDNALARLEDMKRKKCAFDEDLKSLFKQYSSEQTPVEENMERFSKEATSKSPDNNPIITDLSDQNRPTKVARKLSKLYETQWTNAFDILKQQMGEKQVINTLLDTLMTAYDICNKLASNNFFERVQKVMELPTEVADFLSYEVVLTDRLKQEIKVFRQSRAPFVIRDVEKLVQPKLKLADHPSREIQEYVTACVEIAWLCAVQDPPLELDATFTNRFNTNVFKDYTKSGEFVDFVVWPAILLHKGGPLLSKGVAQGKKSDSDEKE